MNNYQAPKGCRVNDFDHIRIEGDFAYCKSHNFVYQPDVEEQKLYNGLACYYTDTRFTKSPHNSDDGCYLRYFPDIGKRVSLKAAFRTIDNTRNIPIGTIVTLAHNWWNAIGLAYKYRIKKENKLDIKYKVAKKAYFNNFIKDSRSRELVNALREDKFLVSVYNKNPDVIWGDHDGEIAIAYGRNKIVGFSSHKHSFQGYSRGCDSILWDSHGHFDKWSKCNTINKTTKIEDVIATLKLDMEKS